MQKPLYAIFNTSDQFLRGVIPFDSLETYAQSRNLTIDYDGSEKMSGNLKRASGHTPQCFIRTNTLEP